MLYPIKSNALNFVLKNYSIPSSDIVYWKYTDLNFATKL